MNDDQLLKKAHFQEAQSALPLMRRYSDGSACPKATGLPITLLIDKVYTDDSVSKQAGGLSMYCQESVRSFKACLQLYIPAISSDCEKSYMKNKILAATIVCPSARVCVSGHDCAYQVCL